MAVVFVQRIADGVGKLAHAVRAIKFGPSFTITEHPDDTLVGESGDGEITGYVEVDAGPSGFVQHKFANLTTVKTAAQGAGGGTLGAWVSVLSVSMTTSSGNKVLIQANLSAYNDGNSGHIEAQITVDGTGVGPIFGAGMSVLDGTSDQVTPYNLPMTLAWEASGLSAASHTFGVQFRPGAFVGNAKIDPTQTQGNGVSTGAPRAGGATLLVTEVSA